MIYRYSAIDTAHRCLYKFKLDYIDKVPGSGPQSIDLAFGTGLHACLQAALEGDDPQAVWSVYWESLRGQVSGADADYDRLGRLGPVFLARFARLHAKHFSPVALEQTLRGNVGGFEFEGTPDALTLYKGVPSVVDFKTSNYAYGPEKIIVNEQMPIYAHLAQQKLGFKAEQIVYYVFIKREERIQVQTLPLTEEYLTNKLNNVTIMIQELENRTQFPKNPGSCTMGQWRCPRFDICHGGGAKNER